MRLQVSQFAASFCKLQLQTLFEEFGEVSSVKIFKSVGSTNGHAIGFVDMPDDREALEALDMLRGELIDGMALRVELSKDRFTSKPGKPWQVPVVKKQSWSKQDEDDEEDLADDEIINSHDGEADYNAEIEAD